MTPASEPRRNREEVARLGNEIFERRVKPLLTPEDDGKYVAIDIATGEYELDPDDYTAVKRLRTRRPSAEVLLLRAGYPAADRIGLR
jgi:hypothetical protein